MSCTNCSDADGRIVLATIVIVERRDSAPQLTSQQELLNLCFEVCGYVTEHLQECEVISSVKGEPVGH